MLSFTGGDVMEFILVLLIIIVICKIFGVSNELLVFGGLVLIELAIIGMMLLFAYFCILILFTRRKKASFSRIDRSPKGNFKVAYYIVDDEEYPCIFPSEMILNDVMYRKERTYHVFFSKKMKKVYDIYTVITCVLGLIFSAFAVYLTLQIVSLIAIY